MSSIDDTKARIWNSLITRVAHANEFLTASNNAAFGLKTFHSGSLRNDADDLGAGAADLGGRTLLNRK
jgi:hypothetical protein